MFAIKVPGNVRVSEQCAPRRADESRPPTPVISSHRRKRDGSGVINCFLFFRCWPDGKVYNTTDDRCTSIHVPGYPAAIGLPQFKGELVSGSLNRISHLALIPGDDKPRAGKHIVTNISFHPQQFSRRIGRTRSNIERWLAGIGTAAVYGFRKRGNLG